MSEPMDILVAEDSKVSQAMLKAILGRWGHRVVLAADGLKALEIMDKPDAPQLILLDWIMPGMDGLDVCRKLLEDPSREPPYIIFLTAKDTMSDMVVGLGAGASDFIKKPFNREELHARINVGQRTLRLQKELVAAREKMANLAMIDPLTGAFNRRAMIEMIEKEQARTIRKGGAIWLALFDVDRFKQINDTHGHHVGDQVLVEFCDVIRKRIRKTDTLSRWGGEEFLLMAPAGDYELSLASVSPLFDRIRQSIEDTPVHAEGKEIRYTTSAGVALLHAHDNLDLILQSADAALYEAKRGGRNRVVGVPERPSTGASQ